ncbi:ABC transporter substrate-binding protein [Brevibacillus massiliensis]|uniref:ABC transporter substrate-binding protein n=1 Tax=Brevibacillus massiliensis TaxID=1118054 RepID=UPI0002D9FD3D|nr:ABC transporter substrate-binding protein [Brevibacillus massiliensis]
MRKTASKWTAAALAFGLLLAGCSSGGNTPSGAAGEKADTGKPKDFVMGIAADAVTLDPSLQSDLVSITITSEIYETLVRYKAGSSELESDLATSWEASPDGLSWTFHLAKDVKFHDGTPFNADAFIFNFERWWDEKNPYHKGDFSPFQADFGGFKDSETCVVKDVQKIDDDTVQINLKQPFSPLLAILSQTEYGIASPEAIKKHNGDILKTPVGTGAFKFVSWTPGDKIVLEKNQDYRQPGMPKLDKLIFQVIKDNTARLNALRAGQIDLMDGLSPSDAASVKSDAKLQLYETPSNNVGYLAMNNLKPPFDNPKVRQAINMAIDKQALIDAYYYGLAEPAVTVLPSKNWAFHTDLNDYEVNVEKAKELLKEAGYPNGFSTELWAMPVARPYMPQPEQIATVLQADLKKIGIDAKIVTMDWATYTQKMKNGEHTMGLMGWAPGTWDPSNLLYTLLHSSNAKPPALNLSFYKNPQVDTLLENALKETDQTKAAELYKQAQQIIHDDAPMVPLVHTKPVLAGASYVKDFVPSPVGTPQF